MAARGFAISGGVSDGDAALLASAAEERGYDSVWLTCVAGTDPVGLLHVALASTDAIAVGVGVVPVDRFEGKALAAALGELPDRAIVGFGAGVPASGSLARLRREVDAFKNARPTTRVAIGGYGPRVLNAAQQLADCVVLNWMTPERLRWAADIVAPRPISLYVACAVGSDGADSIGRALANMARLPYHARHQEAMAATELVGAAPSSRDEVPALLARYAPATPIVNPVTASTADERLRVLQFFAP